MKPSPPFPLSMPACALLLVAFSAAALADSGSTHDRMMSRETASDQEPALETSEDLRNEIRTLRRRLEALEALKPTFTTFMPGFSERFHVMHRAGDAGDWAVAAHEIDEMQRLTRASNYIDSRLGALMQGFMNGNLRALREAVEHANPKSFQAALKSTIASCNGCHTAAGSTIEVSLDVDESLSMRHPHALRKSRAPLDHAH